MSEKVSLDLQEAKLLIYIVAGLDDRKYKYPEARAVIAKVKSAVEKGQTVRFAW